VCQKCKGLFGCNVHMCRRSSLEQPGSSQKVLARPAVQSDRRAGRNPVKARFAGASAADVVGKS
jgi:hypothetical protein